MRTSSPSAYTRYVKRLRILLPLIGVSLITLAILWPYLNKKEHVSILKVDKNSPQITENHMVQPRYASTDKNGQPFQVEAQWGKQHTEKAADLVTPHGVITTEKHGEVQLDADTGHYNMETKNLELNGHVIMKSQDGYHFETTKAQLDAQNKVVDSDAPLDGTGPTGTLKSQDGFTLQESQDGHRSITLKGRSQVTIAPGTFKKAKAK